MRCFLRLPRDVPVMGDCRIFGYIAEPEPPYSTGEILDHSTRLGFDRGESVDHLINPERPDDSRDRLKRTLEAMSWRHCP